MPGLTGLTCRKRFAPRAAPVDVFITGYRTSRWSVKAMKGARSISSTKPVDEAGPLGGDPASGGPDPGGPAGLLARLMEVQSRIRP